METYCGMDCCKECGRRGECGGCIATEGRPFGGSCAAAELVKKGGAEALRREKERLIEEVNALGIPQLKIDTLHLLNGFYVNLEYPLPGGKTVKFLEDRNVYWGNQIEIPGENRCYGIVADGAYLLVCRYEEVGANPELLLYKKRAL